MLSFEEVVLFYLILLSSCMCPLEFGLKRGELNNIKKLFQNYIYVQILLLYTKFNIIILYIDFIILYLNLLFIHRFHSFVF